MVEVYYSHSKQFPPDADRVAIKYILERFPDADITNPADYQRKFDGMYWFERMELCFELIDDADIFVFIEYRGFIGKGVFREVRHAQERGKRMFLLRKGVFYSDFVVTLEDENDWQLRYARVEVNDRG